MTLTTFERTPGQHGDALQLAHLVDLPLVLAVQQAVLVLEAAEALQVQHLGHVSTLLDLK